MGQKMAPGTGLTPRQKQLLELALREPYFLENFYLTGGTALSSWYLHHRESYDLDFFSNKPFDYDKIRRWFRENEAKIKFRAIIFDDDFGFLEVKIRYPNNDRLKIDFGHYSPTQIKKGLVWRGLTIDSLDDITVNKFQTVSERPRTRDYVDLFFILQTTSWSVTKMVSEATKKFHQPFDLLQLQKNFLKVSEYTDFPKMLVPFDQKEMTSFYETLARELKKEVLK